MDSLAADTICNSNAYSLMLIDAVGKGGSLLTAPCFAKERSIFLKRCKIKIHLPKTLQNYYFISISASKSCYNLKRNMQKFS